MCMLLLPFASCPLHHYRWPPRNEMKESKSERDSAIQDPNNNNFQVKNQEHNFALYG